MHKASRRTVWLAFLLIFGSYALFGALVVYAQHLDEKQGKEVAVDLAQSACSTRNDFRDALEQVFVHLDELIAEAGGSGGLTLAKEFADVTKDEDCSAISGDG